MHKKSLEAQETLKDKGSKSETESIEVADDIHSKHNGSKDLRSESIAVLRAKAIEHSARLQKVDSSRDVLESAGERRPLSTGNVAVDGLLYKSRFEDPRKEETINVV